MTPTMKSTIDSSPRVKPCVLIVDDEPSMLEMVTDIVGRENDCRVITASSIQEARQIIQDQPIQVVLLDLNLPDGEGLSLLPILRQTRPSAETVIITGHPSVNGTIGAMRAGALDLLAKPFTAEHLRDRVGQALARHAQSAKTDKRLDRLRSAVRRLNVSRRMVSKKVDLLCNDLINAYSDLSRQFDDVRKQEGFRKMIENAKDLEQMLCHAMDWVLRHCGYANVAVWLASDEGESELGAYMKYTIAGDKELTDGLKESLLPLVHADGFVQLDSKEIRQKLGPVESEYLAGQTVMAVSCTYLGETLATFAAFRDARSPFSEQDGAMLRAISPIFAVALAQIVRDEQGDDFDSDDHDAEDSVDSDSDDNPFYDDNSDSDGSDRDADEKPKKKPSKRDADRHAADWWKRGEPPPF